MDEAIELPAAHPVWCDRRHLDVWPVHTSEIGEVTIGATNSVEVTLHQWSPDAAPVVTVTLVDGHTDIVVDLTPTQALELSQRLQVAGETLRGGAA